MANKATQFKKGKSGNPAGKPKGATNRTTEATRQLIQDIVNKNLDNLEDDLNSMSASNRWTVLEKLTKYFLPALTKNDNNNTVQGAMKIIVEYTDAQKNKPVDKPTDES